MLQALFNDTSNPVYCYFSENNEVLNVDRNSYESNYLAQEATKEISNEKSVSILFVDIADFTALSDKNDASTIAAILKEYYDIAGRVIQNHHGSIIDYYGDGFLAIFGLNGSKQHPKNLIKAAFELQKKVDDFKSIVRLKYNEDFNIRIGAHSGKIIWERIGIPGMQKHAAIGDSVNFTSRLEQANKKLKTHFLISDDLYDKVKKFVRPSNSFLIDAKGKKGLFKVWSL